MARRAYTLSEKLAKVEATKTEMLIEAIRAMAVEAAKLAELHTDEEMRALLVQVSDKLHEAT